MFHIKKNDIRGKTEIGRKLHIEINVQRKSGGDNNEQIVNTIMLNVKQCFKTKLRKQKLRHKRRSKFKEGVSEVIIGGLRRGFVGCVSEWRCS